MVAIRPQSDWELPGREVTGPGPKGVPGTWVIHYPGNNGFHEPRTDAEMIQYLRGMQNSYLNGRGYSVGYSVIVSQSGTAWAARGLEGYPGVRVYNPASNPGKKVPGNFNHVSRSIQIAVSGQNEASPEAVAAVNAIIATEPTWDVIWHAQVDYTSCAGEGIINQIRSGVIGHQEAGDEDMAMIEQYRAVDTRVWPGVKLETGKVYRWTVGDGVPQSATAAIATVTVTEPGRAGWLAVAKPGDASIGGTSALNFAAGQTVSNTTFIPVVNRQFDIKCHADTHVVVDVLGYVK